MEHAKQVHDIEFLKSAGYNLIRKHAKLENRRYYYHCDRLGMLVWQDHLSGDEDSNARTVLSPPKWTRLSKDHPEEGTWSDANHAQFMSELEAMVTWNVVVVFFFNRVCLLVVVMIANFKMFSAGFFISCSSPLHPLYFFFRFSPLHVLSSHSFAFHFQVDAFEVYPSIVVWVPFNEAWGQHRTVEVATWLTKRDPSRLVNAASGGNFWPVRYCGANTMITVGMNYGRRGGR